MDSVDAAEMSTKERLSASPKELIDRAIALRPLLLEEQLESERRGYYSEKIHRAFLDAGFYHILTPKRYGGFEYDLKTFFKVIVEIARGDPGVGWCVCLGHGHTLTTAAYFSPAAQDDVFNGPKGYFRASHTASKMGSSAARRDQRLLRYYRDISTFRGHNTAQYLTSAQHIGAAYFGIRPFGPPQGTELD